MAAAQTPLAAIARAAASGSVPKRKRPFTHPRRVPSVARIIPGYSPKPDPPPRGR